MSYHKSNQSSTSEANSFSVQYPFPWGLGLKLVWSALVGKQRSFLQDARASISLLDPPLEIIGSENIPAHGSCLVCANHYSRPGFHAWWVALGISASLPFDVHWVMTDAWRFERRPLSRQLEAITHWGFKRASRVYSFTSMPSMPPREIETAARAQSVRHLLSYARRAPNPIIGLIPEGHNTPHGQLGVPPSGVGRLVTHLMPFVQRILPAAFYENKGVVFVEFGEPFTIERSPQFSREMTDRKTSDVLMSAIASLLPPHLRGTYL